MGNVKKRAMLDDIAFVFSECARIANMVETDGIRSISRDDASFTLPHPRGDAQMYCGRAAHTKVAALVEEVARAGNLHGRVKTETLHEEVAQLLVSRFLKEARPLEIKQLDRLFNAASKAAQRHFVTRTHFVPCHLMNARQPARFQIGPVTFHSRASFRKILLADRRPRTDAAKSEKEASRRLMLARAIRYYRNFRWVASVEISNCDRDSSAALSNEAVTAALNCLHLLLGVHGTGAMRVGGLNISDDRRAKLTIKSDGILETSLSIAGFGEVGYADSWAQSLQNPDFQHFLALAAVALEVAVAPDLRRPLSRRFLDAVQWFGEACREDSSATRTVKFVTALERMLVTEERDDISSTIADRVAALCVVGEVSRDDWRRKAKSAYDFRSRLVHGSISPRDPEVQVGATAAAEVAEEALQRILDAIGVDGLRDEKITSRQLAKWFQDLLRWADDYEAIVTQSNQRPSPAGEVQQSPGDVTR